MTIKYGELTIIIYNKEQTIIDTFVRWVNNETNIELNKYIFLFDDGIIFDDTTIKDFKYIFLDSCLQLMPMYFQKITKYKIYFCKSNQEQKTHKIDFNNLFKGYSKYNPSVNIESVYNEIYYCHTNLEKLDIFGIIRIPSSEYSLRFQFAYDSGEFTKEEVSYLLYHIFNEFNK